MTPQTELFLVNASLGLYPQLLQDREAFKQQFGRHQLVNRSGLLAFDVRGQPRQAVARATPPGASSRAS